MMKLLAFLWVISFGIGAVSVSLDTSSQPLKCEIRWYCHDIGMPAGEDETTHFRSVFLEPDQSGLIQLNQTYTYAYSSNTPEIQWNGRCEVYRLKMQEHLKIDARTECVQINPNGSFVIPWP